MSATKPTPAELAVILAEHAKWLANPSTGTRSDLTGADLTRANLSWANLTGAIGLHTHPTSESPCTK